jgi:DNA-binding CsgD family transcriptional regulator
MGALSVKYPRVPSGLPRTREVLHQIKDRYVLSSADADTESRPDHGQANLVCWNGGQGNVREPVAKSVRFGLEQISQFPIPSATRLRALFDLTHAEAKLAQHLSRGDSLEEVAEKLSIKMTTARTQLAAVFAKTETRRQAKLVAVLSRVAHLE